MPKPLLTATNLNSNYWTRTFILWYVFCINTSCLYLGELEEIKEDNPPEIIYSVPALGEVMSLKSDEANKAYVLVWEPDGFDNLNFYWNIEGELLGFAEPLFEENTVNKPLCIVVSETSSELVQCGLTSRLPGVW